MYLLLGWRSLEDQMGSISHTIEHVLWGDGRANHTFLIASTREYPLMLIEIDVGDKEKGTKKSMHLNIQELDGTPKNIANIIYIGKAQSPMALNDLIESAYIYVANHPTYNVLKNNCRTFVEYLIDRIPEFKESIPRRNGSILEYYHHKAKKEHPGILNKTKHLLEAIKEHHRKKKDDGNVDDDEVFRIALNENIDIKESVTKKE